MIEEDGRRRQRLHTVLLLGLTLLGAGLRLYGLGRQSLWTDEMHTLAVAGIPFRQETPDWQWRDLLEVTQGPLFMGMAHAWSALVGTSEAALRLLPAAFSIATIPALCVLSAKLVGFPAAAFAALLLAVSPFHVWYAQEFRGYSLVILAAVVSTALLLDLLERPRSPLRYALYGFTLAVGLGASLIMGFVLVVHGLLAALKARDLGPRRLGALVAVFLVVGALATPWLGVFGRHHDVGRAIAEPEMMEPPLRGASTMPPLAVPYAFYAFSAGFSLGPSLEELHVAPHSAIARHLPVIAAVALVYGALAVIGLAWLAGRRRTQAFLIAAWIAIPFAITAWLAATNVKVWNARYVAVAFPAYVIAVGAGLAALPGKTRSLGLGGVVALAVAALWNLYQCPRYAKEDYRSAAAYLDQAIAPGDALIGEGAPGPLFFYAERRPDVYLLLHPHRIGDEGELRRRIGTAVAGRTRVWLLRVRATQSDPENHVGEILGETRRRAARIMFHGIELERYDATASGEKQPTAAAENPGAQPARRASRRPGVGWTRSQPLATLGGPADRAMSCRRPRSLSSNTG